MPFGKFKGRRLGEIDFDYLLWLHELPDLRDPLLTAVQSEIDRREGRAPRSEPLRPRQLPSPDVVTELVNAGLRTLANKYHPDRPGGDPDKMVQLNRAAEFLRAEVVEQLRAVQP